MMLAAIADFVRGSWDTEVSGSNKVSLWEGIEEVEYWKRVDGVLYHKCGFIHLGDGSSFIA